MGECKDNMKPTVEKKGGLLDRLKSKRRKDDGVEADEAKTFADMIEKADEKLLKLLEIKGKDVQDGPALEHDKNRKSLALLQTMSFHVTQIAQLMDDYGAL